MHYQAWAGLVQEFGGQTLGLQHGFHPRQSPEAFLVPFVGARRVHRRIRLALSGFPCCLGGDAGYLVRPASRESGVERLWEEAEVQSRIEAVQQASGRAQAQAQARRVGVEETAAGIWKIYHCLDEGVYAQDR